MKSEQTKDKMSNYPHRRNPFEDDEDDDEYSFGNKPSGSSRNNKYGQTETKTTTRVGTSGSARGSGGGYSFYHDEPSDFERPKTKLELLEEQKQLSRSRQADMTRNALSSIYDSERMGMATAEVYKIAN